MSTTIIQPAVLNREQAAAFTALSVSTMEKLLRARNFPPPRLLAGRRVGWLVRELSEWAESLPVSDQLPPPNTGALKPNRRPRAVRAEGRAAA